MTINAQRTPKSVIAGHLAVGTNDAFEVVVNLDGEINGVGHLCFSPSQARGLARLLAKHAQAADEAYRKALRKRA